MLIKNMRIIIPHAYNVKGGVERTTISLIKEFINLISQVILILPDRQIPYFKTMLPPSGKLIYETFSWPQKEQKYQRICFKVAKRILLEIKKIINSSLIKRAVHKIKKTESNLRLDHLCRKYKATHCLYMITGGQRAPKINIPLAVILYDLYWHYKPDRYPKDFRDARDNNLKEWLEKADVLFSISNFTRNNIIRIFPQYKDKIKTVSLAADPDNMGKEHSAMSLDLKEDVPVFYYPASLNAMHKNFYKLFSAAKKLAHKQLQFKIIITGRDTERLLSADKSKPRQDEQARIFYMENRKLLEEHIEVRGYCSREKVEELYKRCFCVVLPSKLESSSLLPLTEALARGILVISSDIEEIKEYIDLYKCSDRVKLFPVDEDDILANEMEDVLNYPPKRMSPDRISKIFSHWTWANVAKADLKYLQEIN